MMDIRIPKLGTAMQEGTVAEWLVSDGDDVAEGDPIYVVETDKTETEITAPTSGTIRLLAVVGDTLPIGTKVAEIG
jgi:pyruvate/2-oxoglutarate dehydrogenase complex dihydrolipoamide acyltransferase (E2) component